MDDENKAKTVRGYVGLMKLLYSTELFKRCTQVVLTNYTDPLEEVDKIRFQNCLKNSSYVENLLNETEEESKKEIKTLLLKHKQKTENNL
jgi:hypothetical protein